jgi:hypothetical protein
MAYGWTAGGNELDREHEGSLGTGSDKQSVRVGFFLKNKFLKLVFGRECHDDRFCKRKGMHIVSLLTIKLVL